MTEADRASPSQTVIPREAVPAERHLHPLAPPARRRPDRVGIPGMTSLKVRAGWLAGLRATRRLAAPSPASYSSREEVERGPLDALCRIEPGGHSRRNVGSSPPRTAGGAEFRSEAGA